MAGATSCWTHGLQWSLLVSFFAGVSAADSSVAGLAASASICFILLIGIIFFIGLSFTWSDWYNNWMQSKDKVRMPKAYWKKKEEAKRKLISGTTSHGTPSVVNGSLPVQNVDRAPDSSRVATESKNHILNYTPTQFLNESQYVSPHQPKINGTSWVQGWSQRSNQFANKIYEVKDVTMDLGEEQDEEFRIETELTDNEVLDVGPFKSSHVNEQPIQGDIYPEPYIYTTIDNAKRYNETLTNTTSATTTVATTRVEGPHESTEMQEINSGVSSGGEFQITSTEDMLVHL